jgi:protein-disulfide isomerase
MSSASRPPSRNDRREEARRTRLEHEHAEAIAATRRRRIRLLRAIAGVAAVIVAGAILATSGGGAGEGAGSPSGSARSSSSVAGAAEARAVLSGVPQRDVLLGRPSAPVRVIEFADPQCPFCRDFAVRELPAFIRGPVRGGRVRMEFRTLAFIGADSEKAARFIEATGLQNRLWYAVEMLFANQGAENSGWVTDALLRSVAAAIPGLDEQRALAAVGSAQVTARLRANERLAGRHGVSSTPTFLVGRGNAFRAVGPDQLTAAVQAALKTR